MDADYRKKGWTRIIGIGGTLAAIVTAVLWAIYFFTEARTLNEFLAWWNTTVPVFQDSAPHGDGAPAAPSGSNAGQAVPAQTPGGWQVYDLAPGEVTPLRAFGFAVELALPEGNLNALFDETPGVQACRTYTPEGRPLRWDNWDATEFPVLVRNEQLGYPLYRNAKLGICAAVHIEPRADAGTLRIRSVEPGAVAPEARYIKLD